MESLPREIILNILSRLPLSFTVQSKLVCRAWRNIARDPQLVDVHLSHAAESTPCLIFYCDYPHCNQLYFVNFSAHDHDNDMVAEKCVPFPATRSDFDVVGSCNGLLCLSDSLDYTALSIYNPFTRDHKELPLSTQYREQEVVFGFGFHPTTKEYKVVKVVYYPEAHGCVIPEGIHLDTDVQILTLGSPTWRSIGKVRYYLTRWSSQVLVNGRLHWITRARSAIPARLLVSFDLANEQFRQVQRPECGVLNRCKYHLVVLGNCLSAAVYCKDGTLEIWVMRDYDVKESWIKKFIIGSYLPKGLKQEVGSSFKNSKIATNGEIVKVICLMKNGEILLEYESRALVSYDPKRETFKDVMFGGMPNWFQTVVHKRSLNWVDTPINT